ncbi:MAG: phosphoribosylformylglycinamidine cyclo-ligase [Candidatus Marinimicrobia bacterium]|nr:phosphoribosylformylglycinamidine cyclo-ligase [Candidatus Neomarinimicrobiota bacterium]
MTTYKESGVDIDLANKSIDSIKKKVKSTFDKNTLSNLGAFGGCYLFPKDDYDEPVLVSSTDGVGTKLKIAFLTKNHRTIGRCLVNHCVNDILVLGAKPLFFLDYFGTGKLDPLAFKDVVGGMTEACKENSCVLIAGETAEMPGFYKEGEYDLSGTVVGAVDRKNMMSERKVLSGDVLIGLPSSGLHTNGYSLARKVLLEKFSADEYLDQIGCTVGEALLSVHRSYLNILNPILDEKWLHGISHITGGGIIENTERVVSASQKIEIDWSSWKTLSIFELIKDIGNVPTEDMRRSFNLGIGMVLIVEKDSVEEIDKYLKNINEPYSVIGEIV